MSGSNGASEEIVKIRGNPGARSGLVGRLPSYEEIRIPAAEFRALKRTASSFADCIAMVRRRSETLGLRYDLPFSSRVAGNGDLVQQNVAERRRGYGGYAQ